MEGEEPSVKRNGTPAPGRREILVEETPTIEYWKQMDGLCGSDSDFVPRSSLDHSP